LLVLLVAPPQCAVAQTPNPFDMIQKIAPGIPIPGLARPGTTPAPQVTAPQTGTPAASSLQPVSTTAPAAKRSARDPVALVEAVSDARAGVDLMDYVYVGQVIALGANGTLSLAYFESCTTETIKGGTVTVGTTASTVRGGQVNAAKVACQGAKPIITADAREAGASVKRLGPDGKPAPHEWTIKSERPMFKWSSARGQKVTVALYEDDKARKQIWRRDVTAGFLEYPADAPKLAEGVPYLVEAQGADGRLLRASFSIDDGLEVADNPANRLVQLVE
jgi:hypothetical protein